MQCMQSIFVVSTVLQVETDLQPVGYRTLTTYASVPCWEWVVAASLT